MQVNYAVKKSIAH